MTMTKKRKRGRPVIRKLPDPIPDTPENIALAIMQGSPKDEWRYLEEYRKQTNEGGKNAEASD